METVTPINFYKGRRIETLWSPSVAVTEVLFSVKVSRQLYHGIRASYVDENFWNFPSEESLLWVFDDGHDLKLCQEMHQQGPRIINDKLQFDIEAIIGTYQSAIGNIFLAVKWQNSDYPTWELEDDIIRCGDVTNYYKAAFYEDI